MVYKNRALVVHYFSQMPNWGRNETTTKPFTWSNLEISKSVPGLKAIFSKGRVDPKNIFRSNDRDTVEIPVVLGNSGSARNFTISLRPIAENRCHIEIKEHFPRSASKTILDDAGIIHYNQETRIDGEDNLLVSHLRREIEFLTNARAAQQASLEATTTHQSANRNLATAMAKPNNSIQTGGLTIEGSNEKVTRFLSKPNIQVNRESSPQGKLEKLIKLTDPSAPPKESTLKFKLANPNGEDQAKLTVSDRSGNVFLKDSTIKIERSTRHQDRSPAVQALFKAVARLNNQYNAAHAA